MKALERLLNNLLRRDPETLEQLSGLSGKVIRVELLNTTQPITSLHLETHGIRIETHAGEGDVLIRGTPLNLLAYLRTAAAGGAALSSNLEIRGDLGLAQEVQRLLRGFDPDLEEQLARYLGDTLARKTANLARAGAGFLRQLQHKVELDLGEYALYETETLPERDELERFNHAVDTLRDDVERLKQRVDRLCSL